MMDQNQIYQMLMSLNSPQQQQQNPAMQQLQGMTQNNPNAYLAAIRNPAYQGMMGQRQPQGQQQQGQQPSWMDSLNMMMAMGGIMGQNQGQSNQYGMGGMMGMQGQQAQSNWWQKGLQGAGSTLSALGPAAIQAAPMAGAFMPHAAIGGVAASGLGNLFQYLGQPSQQQQPTYQGGWA